MKTVFFTYCTDDWFELGGCYKLQQSLRRFHPTIPSIRFGSDGISEALRLEPHLYWDNMIPFWGQKLAQDFDLVIHLDADSIVVDALPELLRGDFDVAGVRNNDDFGDHSFTCPGVAVHEYMKCGLVAATHRQFWDDWLSANLESARLFPLAEQDVMNGLLRSSKYQ